MKRVAFLVLFSLAACGQLIGLGDLERGECLDVCTDGASEQGRSTSGAGSGGVGGSAATALGGTLGVAGGGAPPSSTGGTTNCDVPGDTDAPDLNGGAGAASGGTEGGVSGGGGLGDGAGVGGQAGGIAIDLPIRINFQPRGADVPTGYTPDIGLTFAPQDGLNFGWSVDHTDVTRDRGVNSNQLLDTLCQFHEGASWELALPNGTYSVLVSVGDARLASTYTLIVEDVTYWRGRVIDANQFLSTTNTIAVTDGRLTLTQGSAGELATRINFLEVSAP